MSDITGEGLPLPTISINDDFYPYERTGVGNVSRHLLQVYGSPLVSLFAANRLEVIEPPSAMIDPSGEDEDRYRFDERDEDFHMRHNKLAAANSCPRRGRLVNHNLAFLLQPVWANPDEYEIPDGVRSIIHDYRTKGVMYVGFDPRPKTRATRMAQYIQMRDALSSTDFVLTIGGDEYVSDTRSHYAQPNQPLVIDKFCPANFVLERPPRTPPAGNRIRSDNIDITEITARFRPKRNRPPGDDEAFWPPEPSGGTTEWPTDVFNWEDVFGGGRELVGASAHSGDKEPSSL